MSDDRIRSSAPFARDDRGVSEVLAFVLVFGIILSSVTILSMTGFQAMESYQEGEQQRNADRAMVTLADNFNDVLRHGGVEERYGELTVRGGTIAVDGDSGAQLEITVDGNSITNEPEFDHLDDPLTLGSFTYESGSETISYEGGAVVRQSDAGSIVLDDPHLQYQDHSSRDVAVVSIVKIDGDRRSIQSDGSQGFTISVENRTSKLFDGTIQITAEGGETETVWEEGILQDGDWDSGHSDVDRVLVTIVEVEIDY